MILFSITYTLTEFLRAWASDNPHLRTIAYYFKSMVWCFAIVVLSILFIGRDAMIFAGFWNEGFPRYVYDEIDLVVHTSAWLVIMLLPCFLAYGVCKEWITHYRTLSRALSERRDPDLCDRARMAEMRRTILGWAWNSGYVRYDREKGWRLNAPSKGSKGGRLIE